MLSKHFKLINRFFKNVIAFSWTVETEDFKLQRELSLTYTLALFLLYRELAPLM